MVRREADGRTLYWIQDGQKIAVNMMEHQFGDVHSTQDLQISAKRQNFTRRDNYINALAQQQVSLDASRPYTNPAEPLMIVVSDPVMDEYGDVEPGIVSEVPWMPPLPTLKHKTNIFPSK